jgi:hypothetical protein
MTREALLALDTLMELAETYRPGRPQPDGADRQRLSILVDLIVDRVGPDLRAALSTAPAPQAADGLATDLLRAARRVTDVLVSEGLLAPDIFEYACQDADIRQRFVDALAARDTRITGGEE